jgi:hypothetical protein
MTGVGMQTRERLEELTAEAEFDDSSMVTVAVHEDDATLRVRTPSHTPLSAGETHAELVLTGADTEVSVELSGPQVRALAAVLEDDSDV